MSKDNLSEPKSEHIESLLYRRLGGLVRNLHVRIRDEGLVLEGQATTYYAKQLAQHAAMEISETIVSANDIEVR